MLSDLLYRLRALFRRRAMEADLDEELRYHLERQTEKNCLAATPDEAARRARLDFGGPAQVQEECRDARGTRWIEDLFRDVRFGFRSMVRKPVFGVTAVLSLALAIGANTAIFSVVDSVLLRSLPYREPGRLAMIWDTFPARGQTHNVVSPVDYLRWHEEAIAFEQMAAVVPDVSNLTAVAEPREIRGQTVTDTFFPVLGAAPALGRAFTAEEARTAAKVIVLGHRFWTQYFHSDQAVLGRAIELDRQQFTVIGVMPEDFEFLDVKAEYWLPFSFDPHRDYRASGRYLRAVGRLKPGVSLAAAQAQLNGIAARAVQNDPAFSRGWGARLVDLRDEVSGDYRRPLYVLLGAVCLVLLIACVNVANLLLSRSQSRSRELAIRASLGAGPRRIARQLLAECGLLAAMGGGLGLLLAVWSIRALKTAAAVLPRLATVGIDIRVLGFTTLISLGVALLVGTAPAWIGARMRDEKLKQSRRSGRLPDMLVVVEVALSLVLLAGAGLLIRSFANLLSVNTGFRSDHLLTARILLPGTYQDAQGVAFFEEATRRLEELPGVVSASAVSFMPFGGLRPGTGFTVENRPKPAAGEGPTTEVRSIRPNYFRTMGIPLLRGRDFTGHDADPEHPVLIVNQSLAAKYWPNEDPIGQRIAVGIGKRPMPGEIVGIAADTKDQTLDGKAAPCVFFPHPDLPIGYMSLVARTSVDPAAMSSAIQRVVHAIDSKQTVADLQTMDQMLARSVSTQRLEMLLLAIFAAMALVLAAVGIYGVISYSVARRTNEIGIRIALGARPGNVLRLVMVQGGRIVAGGLALGFAGAWALTRTIAVLLFEVKPADPVTFGAVALVLAAVAFAAIAGPARRATRVDPLAALRCD